VILTALLGDHGRRLPLRARCARGASKGSGRAGVIAVVSMVAAACSSEPPASPAVTARDLCANIACGDGRCDPAETAPWGSVCPDDCRARYASELDPSLAPFNEYCDLSQEYLRRFGPVEAARRVPQAPLVLDALHTTSSVVIAPQEFCPGRADPAGYVYLNPQSRPGAPACRGIATRNPQLRFVLRTASAGMTLRLRMHYPVSLVVRGPEGRQACVDDPYIEAPVCSPDHLRQYRSRGAPVELSLRFDHPSAGEYAVWVPRLSWWDGMGRGEIDLSITGVEAVASPTLPSQATQGVTSVPPRPPAPLPDTARAPIMVEASRSPVLRQCEQLYDRCSVSEDIAEQRRLGAEGVALLQNVAPADRISADILRIRLRRCAEAEDAE
jgi:hypothetical protein